MSYIESMRQTIRTEGRVCGVGLHSGKPCAVTLTPASAATGVVVNGTPATVESIDSGFLATRLMTQSGFVSTTEHLFAALNGLQIDDIILTVDGGEVPILDGSSLQWIEHLTPAASQPQTPAPVYRLSETVEVRDDFGYVRASPADELLIDVELDYALLGHARFSASASDWLEAASARTFGFLDDHPALLARGLAQGADLSNTVVFGRDGEPLNENGLRMRDEVARHKWLDCLGDLRLLGSRLQARVHAVRAGHRLHHHLVAALWKTMA